MKPIMLSEETKKILDEFKWEHREEILSSSKVRKFASYDKTLIFLLSNFRRSKK